MVDPIREVREVFQQYAEREFLIETATGRQFSYAEFFELARQAAYLLYHHGIQHHDRVALVLTNSVEFAALYFGCLFLGAVAVPVNPSLHRRDITFILGHSGIKLVVCSPMTRVLIAEWVSTSSTPVLHLLPQQEQSRVDVDLDWWTLGVCTAPHIPNWEPLDNVQIDDLFSITFTSGTTSKPKGVAHRIYGLLGNARVFNEELAFDPDNRFLHTMPMAYMAGFLNTLLSPFLAGASIVLTNAFNAQSALRFWRPVMRYHADTFWMAPTMLAALLRIDRDDKGREYCSRHVKTICAGTAPLPLKIKREFEQRYGVELFESYGLSELLFVTSNSKRWPRLDKSVGRLLPGGESRIVNEHGILVARGDDGDIQIRTPYIMAGYLDYQTLEPIAIEPDAWFPTGDIGHVDANGYHFITGRKKDLIIRGGINISPRAVEEVLLEHEVVEQVAVIGLPHDFYGEEVVAVVKLKGGYALETVLPELSTLCTENLSSFSTPTRFIELEHFPVSTTGKVQKATLRESLIAQSEKDGS